MVTRPIKQSNESSMANGYDKALSQDTRALQEGNTIPDRNSDPYRPFSKVAKVNMNLGLGAKIAPC